MLIRCLKGHPHDHVRDSQLGFARVLHSEQVLGVV